MAKKADGNQLTQYNLRGRELNSQLEGMSKFLAAHIPHWPKITYVINVFTPFVTHSLSWQVHEFLWFQLPLIVNDS